MTTTATPTASRPMTADEFFDWVHRPENRDRGEVVEKSRPGERHGFVCANVAFFLMAYVRERRQGDVLSNDTGLILARDPDTVRGPDEVLYTTTRRSDDLRVRYSDEPPTLAVEVLSPNDRWPGVTRRVTQLLQRGVAVDPDSRTLRVHRAGQLPQVLEGNDEWTCEDVLPDFRCRVADLFYLTGEPTPVSTMTP